MTKLIAEWSVAGTLINEDPRRDCSSIEKDHLGDRSPEKDFCWQLTFQQPVQKPSSESSDSFSQHQRW